MRHYPDLEDVHLENTWLTIGTFDGVHRGHQEIVHKLAAGAHANGTLAVVLTFYPHPAIVLGRRTEPFYLTNPEERAHLLAQHGADAAGGDGDSFHLEGGETLDRKAEGFRDRP